MSERRDRDFWAEECARKRQEYVAVRTLYGNILDWCRYAKGMSFHALARKLNLTDNQVENIAHGKNLPKNIDRHRAIEEQIEDRLLDLPEGLAHMLRKRTDVANLPRAFDVLYEQGVDLLRDILSICRRNCS
jgi:ribosome-binding protein aMBF1 (putative translation factor)